MKPDVGATAEYLFASECLSRGLLPNWPSADSAAYDMVVDTGKKLQRIQVKGTEKSTEVVEFVFSMKDHGKTRHYTKKDVDFIVLYLFANAVWYILPIEKAKRTIRIRPNDIWCKCREFRNAWHLIDKSLKK